MSLDNYCDVLQPGNMAQKWDKVTSFCGIMKF